MSDQEDREWQKRFGESYIDYDHHGETLEDHHLDRLEADFHRDNHHTTRLPGRRSTGSIKWDLASPDEIPLWVADMDFPVPSAVTAALSRRLEHPIFGYSVVPDAYPGAVQAWQKERNGWDFPTRDVVVVPSVMQAIAVVIEEFTTPGERIGVFSPVYFPFYDVVEELGRTVVRIPLMIEETEGADPRYRFDTEALQETVGNLSMILLCSPHNPGGRVWSAGELNAVRKIAGEAGVRVVSDEIHGDLVFPDSTFVPWLKDGGDSGDIALFAPSKTFNIPGLPTAVAVVHDEETRKRLRNALHARMHKISNLLTMEGALAAYRHGAPWLDGLRPLLRERYGDVLRRCSALEGVRVFAMEGTFIAWIDLRERWGLPRDARFPAAEGRGAGKGVSTRFTAHARTHGVWLSDGSHFGGEGDGFMRLNFATSSELLDEGLTRFERSVRTFEP